MVSDPLAAQLQLFSPTEATCNNQPATKTQKTTTLLPNKGGGGGALFSTRKRNFGKIILKVLVFAGEREGTILQHWFEFLRKCTVHISHKKLFSEQLRLKSDGS